MFRSLLAVLLGTAVLAMPARAHYVDPRPIPGYDDGEQVQPGGHDDRYGTADARDNGDPRDAAPPPPRPPRASGGYVDPSQDVDPFYPTPLSPQPAPDARRDQVDAGRPDDAAHRADRTSTADLNHRRWPDRNATPGDTGGDTGGYAASHARYQAELADHARAMQDYRAEQARYADRIARWRARADACEAGNRDACNGPE